MKKVLFNVYVAISIILMLSEANTIGLQMLTTVNGAFALVLVSIKENENGKINNRL